MGSANFTYPCPRSAFLLSFLYPLSVTVRLSAVSLRSKNSHQRTEPKDSHKWGAQIWENAFFSALARATTCSQHSAPIKHSYSSPLFTYHRGRRRPFFNANEPIRYYHQGAVKKRAPPQNVLTREECLQMVDYYREWYSTQARPLLPEPPPPPPPYIARLDGERLLTSGETYGSIAVEKVRTLVERPEVSHISKTLDNPRCTHLQAFEAYKTLPFPGIAYLNTHLRKLLFKRLSVIETKSQASMVRYLSVVDDMKSAGFVITQWQWNTAMSFAGRCFRAISSAEVDSAMNIWREHGTNTTLHERDRSISLSVLFDLAAKAGKFALAELILKEVQACRLPLDRHARVGLIFYEGLRGDGQGIRGQYRDFVNSGEVVDTVVLNCVIASLLRAGEPAAAQQVYERMKRLVAPPTDAETFRPMDWESTRSLTAVLRKAAVTYKDQPEKIQELQASQTLAPDLRTFNIFLEHHIQETGSLNAIAALLEEMRIMGVPIHGKIFVKLFRGFSQRGGISYTTWTRARLESVWAALVEILDQEDGDVKESSRRVAESRAVDDPTSLGHSDPRGDVATVDNNDHREEENGEPGDNDEVDDNEGISPSAKYLRQGRNVWLSKWLVIWCVRAFAKCYGPGRTWEIWDELRARWEPEDDKEEEAVNGVVRDIERRLERGMNLTR